MSGGRYPTDEDLKRIDDWPNDDPHGLLDFIASIWSYADWGWQELEGREGEDATRVVLASTAGWSGNEDIMEHCRMNFFVYHQFFDSYRRGGHYQFSLPARKK